jgi:hypothetical protein
MLSRYTAEIGTACVTAALGLIILVGATEFGIGWGSAGPEPGAFPFYMGLLVTAASIGTIVQTIATRTGRGIVAIDREQAVRVASFFRPMVLFLIVAGFFYVVLELWFRVPLAKGPLEAAFGIY